MSERANSPLDDNQDQAHVNQLIQRLRAGRCSRAKLAERAAEVANLGYTALKFEPFGNAYRFIDRQELDVSLEIIKAVRDAVGDEVDILIEGHDRFSVSTAIEDGNAIADFRPMWFETPVMSTEAGATAEVARAIPVRVVAGEPQQRKTEFAHLL